MRSHKSVYNICAKVGTRKLYALHNTTSVRAIIDGRRVIEHTTG